jgi:HlyD family secretion protein
MKIELPYQFGVAWATVLAMSLSASAQIGPAPIVVAPVVVREVAAAQSFVSTIMPVKKAIVGSAVDGRVVEYLVNEGDRVSEGQALAQLLTATITLELAAARAELELRQQELNELNNGSRPEEIEQARARMASFQAMMKYNQAKYTRTRKLHEQSKTITKEKLDEAFSAMRNASEQYGEAKAAHQLAVAGPRQERIAQSQARLAVQQALADKLADQFKKHTIIARFAGYVTAEYTESGAWVSRGDPVAEIVALDDVDVQASVLEDYIPHIKVGYLVRVEVPSLPQHVFMGAVDSIVPQADVRARTFPVKIRVKNDITEDGPLLKAGMLARVVLPTGSALKAPLVPKDALVLGGRDGPLVFVFQPGAEDPQQGKVRPVRVQLGIAEGTLIQIRGDLSEGQLVVVLGNERLHPGQDAVVTQRVDPETLHQAKIPGGR